MGSAYSVKTNPLFGVFPPFIYIYVYIRSLHIDIVRISFGLYGAALHFFAHSFVAIYR